MSDKREEIKERLAAIEGLSYSDLIMQYNDAAVDFGKHSRDDIIWLMEAADGLTAELARLRAENEALKAEKDIWRTVLPGFHQWFTSLPGNSWVPNYEGCYVRIGEISNLESESRYICWIHDYTTIPIPARFLGPVGGAMPGAARETER